MVFFAIEPSIQQVLPVELANPTGMPKRCMSSKLKGGQLATTKKNMHGAKPKFSLQELCIFSGKICFTEYFLETKTL
jgi:hypothetical protein